MGTWVMSCTTWPAAVISRGLCRSAAADRGDCLGGATYAGSVAARDPILAGARGGGGGCANRADCARTRWEALRARTCGDYHAHCARHSFAEQHLHVECV